MTGVRRHSPRTSCCGLHSRGLPAQYRSMNNSFPTLEELAREAREALRSEPAESADEHFNRLVRLGWINARGEVTKLIGGSADSEPIFQSWTDGERPVLRAREGA